MRDWRDEIQPEQILRKPIMFGPIDGCELCGIAEAVHPAEVYGLGHFSTRETMPTGYVAPSAALMAERQAMRESHGLPIAEVEYPSGRVVTHLVRATCPCGADAVCTPERVEGARCGACALKQAERRVADPAYDMRHGPWSVTLPAPE